MSIVNAVKVLHLFFFHLCHFVYIMSKKIYYKNREDWANNDQLCKTGKHMRVFTNIVREYLIDN